MTGCLWLVVRPPIGWVPSIKLGVCFRGFVLAMGVAAVCLSARADRGLPDSLRINQLQVIGSHNSFKRAIDPALYKIMLAVRSESRELDYAHPPLRDQLNLGLRSLELDIFHDPKGGLYAEPLGLAAAGQSEEGASPYDERGQMRAPGFKVLHVQDIDFRSNNLTLVSALKELRSWSDCHPDHLPVFITLNLSDDPIQIPNSTVPARYDRAAFDALDRDFVEHLGRERLIVPDDVRGEYETLEQAVLAGSWPQLASARGRFLVVIDDDGRKRDGYVEGHHSLRGRPLFVHSPPGTPESAFLIRNNALVEGETIRGLVREGYLVRTRADAGTHEARRGDFSRFESAKACGAQVISTDYYLADWRLNPEYRIRFNKGRCVRRNPITCN